MENQGAFHYRSGTIDDIEDVFRLNRNVFDEVWSKDAMLQSLQIGYALYVCYEQRQLLGYALSQDVLDETQLMQLAVAPSYRRLGIAKALMTLLMQDKQDMTELMLEVRVSNIGAHALYGQLGFVEVGRRPNYYVRTKSKPCEAAILFSFFPRAKAWRCSRC